MTKPESFKKEAGLFTGRLGRVFLLGLIVLLALNGAVFASSSGDTKNTPASDKDKAADTTETHKGDSATTAPTAAKPAPLTTDEQVQVLNDKVKKLEEIIDRQQKALDALETQSKGGAVETADASGTESASAAATAASARSTGSAAPATATAARRAQGDQSDSPLQLKIGNATIIPIGFADFTAVFRSTNGGSGIGTNFGSIPFSNTTAGRLTETKFSAQNSRFGFRIDADVHGAHVMGYLESDFLGATPANLAVSSNSDAGRLRLYWVDVRKDKLEFLAGQSWSMLTPGRKGISGLPGDIFYSQDMDTNYQLGLIWARQAQFRFIYHATDAVTLGLSLENPDQYIGGSGGGGTITIPSAFATTYASQLDNATGNGTNVPNLHPDVIGKIALDPMVGDKLFHIEFAGVVRSFKVLTAPIAGKTNTTTGGAGAINFNLEIFKNFHLISNNYWGTGGGRYIFGQAPDVTVRADGSLATLNSGSTVDGFEATIHNTLLYGYYGGVYVDHSIIIDPATGKPVGYGFSGSSSGNNRASHEATFGLIQTLWKDPKWGALSLITQYSYLLRHPWSVAPGAPTDAHSNMFWIDLRYALPGAPPKTGK